MCAGLDFGRVAWLWGLVRVSVLIATYDEGTAASFDDFVGDGAPFVIFMIRSICVKSRCRRRKLPPVIQAIVAVACASVKSALVEIDPELVSYPATEL